MAESVSMAVSTCSTISLVPTASSWDESLAPALLENLHPGTGRGLGFELGAMTFLPRVALAADMLRDRPPPISHVSRRCFFLSTQRAIDPQKRLRTRLPDCL
jgi:hypothetical protein